MNATHCNCCGNPLVEDAAFVKCMACDTKACDRLAAVTKELESYKNLAGQPQCWKVEHVNIEAQLQAVIQENGTLKDACRQHLTMLENAVTQLVKLKFDE